MSHDKKKKKKLKGPWDAIQTAIWLIGLAVLAVKGWWWPGILVLVALSVITEAIIEILVPDAVETVESEEKAAPFMAGEEKAAPVPKIIVTPHHPVHRLPSVCPQCNAPVRGHEVQWTGHESAGCAYCGANLPLVP